MVFQYIWRCFSPAGYFDTFHYRKKKQVPTSDSMTRNYRYRVTHIPGCWRHQEIVQQQIGGGTLFRPGNFGMMLGFCGGKSDSKKNIKRYTVFFFYASWCEQHPPQESAGIGSSRRNNSPKNGTPTPISPVCRSLSEWPAPGKKKGGHDVATGRSQSGILYWLLINST